MNIRDNDVDLQQASEDAQNWFAEVAFSAIFNLNDSDNANQWLVMLRNEPLDRLIHTCKKLMVLAQAEQRNRQARKAAK